MVKIAGLYSNEAATTPDYIRGECEHVELERLREHIDPNLGRCYGFDPANPSVPLTALDDKPPYSFYMPADKQAVRNIAKHVELDCDDPNLIDWMRQP